MRKIRILLAATAVLFTTQTVDAVVITNAFITDSEPTICDASRLPIVDTFYEKDKLVCFFISVLYADIGDTYKTQWYYKGQIYIDEDINTVSAYGLSCISRSMKIFGAEPMDMPGMWEVRFYYNDQYLLRWSFEIKERCAARTALSGDSESLNALRAFRDHTLNKTRFGRKAVDLFYAYSPALSKAMDDNPALKAGARTLLTTFASVINMVNTSVRQ